MKSLGLELETKMFTTSLCKGRGPLPEVFVAHYSHKCPAKPQQVQQCWAWGPGVPRDAKELTGERGFTPPTVSYFSRKPRLQKPCCTWQATDDPGCNCHCEKGDRLLKCPTNFKMRTSSHWCWDAPSQEQNTAFPKEKERKKKQMIVLHSGGHEYYMQCNIFGY